MFEKCSQTQLVLEINMVLVQPNHSVAGVTDPYKVMYQT